MRKVKESIRMAVVIVATLALAALSGILVTHADGPVLWKQHCPAHHEVQFVPATDWGGVHVLCVWMVEEEGPGARK